MRVRTPARPAERPSRRATSAPTRLDCAASRRPLLLVLVGTHRAPVARQMGPKRVLVADEIVEPEVLGWCGFVAKFLLKHWAGLSGPWRAAIGQAFD